MSILRMTNQGKLRFIEYLDSLKTDSPQKFPEELLVASPFAEEVGGDRAWLDSLNLDDKLECAKGLDDIVNELNLSSAEKDWAFWTWCSAYLFARLCKRNKSQRYAPGELSIWVAEPHNYQRYYRHYLVSIWQVYSAHKDIEEELRVLLTGPVNTPGELWGQIAATQTLITNKAMISTISLLFWDASKGVRKRGAGGAAGRRFTQVLKQFQKTYDFFSMSADQIIELLPAEFNRFKPIAPVS